MIYNNTDILFVLNAQFEEMLTLNQILQTYILYNYHFYYAANRAVLI
jgi:hypothetical protein